MRLIVIMLTSFVTANKRPAVSRALALPLGVTFHHQESAWQDEPLVRVQDMPCGRYQSIRTDARTEAECWSLRRLETKQGISRQRSGLISDSDCTWHILALWTIWTGIKMYEYVIICHISIHNSRLQRSKFQQKVLRYQVNIWLTFWNGFFSTFFSRRWKLTGSSTAGLALGRWRPGNRRKFLRANTVIYRYL